MAGRGSIKALLGFDRDYEHVAEKIRESLENGNREEAGRIVHALKGVSGNLSITDVYEISESLDTHIRENRNDGITLVESLENALKIAVAAIRKIGTQTKTEIPEREKGTLDPSALKELFIGMLASFEEYNPNAAEPFIKELGRSLPPEQLEPVRQCVDGFDFDGARKKRWNWPSNWMLM